MKNILWQELERMSGKTVISAILVEKLQADYWKPIQAGDLENSDTQKVQSLTSVPKQNFHTETYQLQTPMSPHASAEIDKVRVDLARISNSQKQKII